MVLLTADRNVMPRTGPEREILREKGQFWTPPWIAEAMVAYLISDGNNSLFDPAVGRGAFFRAAKVIASGTGGQIKLLGAEVDPAALEQALTEGLSLEDLQSVEVRDFLFDPPKQTFKGIVANPPYIRHHRLSESSKLKLKEIANTVLGHAIDGRAGLHIYFLIRSLQLLENQGKLAFIMPADTCEGVFAPSLWEWITRNFCLEAVITFAANASPFPGVDTNPLIFLIKKAMPNKTFLWVQCRRSGTRKLGDWIVSRFKNVPGEDLSVRKRYIVEAIKTGLSRPHVANKMREFTLADFATVLRGIATGSNDFFFLTRHRVKELRIPNEFVLPAIGRTRDVQGAEITKSMIFNLDSKGRPTLLVSLDGSALETLPIAVRQYIEHGQSLNLHKRPLLASRRPWYKMEIRRVPEFLFAYLGRRSARFIRNTAGVVPLSGFLCVYPRRTDKIFIEKLWAVLQHPATVKALRLVGKSYGGGAIKVEPRALEQLPILRSVLLEAGLELPVRSGQLALL